MTNLEKLDGDSFYNIENYSQITIDFIEELSDITDYYDENDEETEAQLEQLTYEIKKVLEVLNPALEVDREGLLVLLDEIEMKNF